MKRCTLIIPDSGPFNSLWVADQLPLLLALDMRIVVLDAIVAEVTSDPKHWPKDAAVKEFIETHQPPFVIEQTGVWQDECARRTRRGRKRNHIGELAIADFLNAEDGLRKYLAPGEPVLLLFKDAGFRVFEKPPHLHMLSTVGILRSLERVGVVKSTDSIIHEMTRPTKPGRRTEDAAA